MNESLSIEEKNAQWEALLRSVGSTPLYDVIFIGAFPLLGSLAILGNLLSHHIFSARYFQQKPLYTYLRLCCLNSSLVCFVYAIAFVCDSRRYLPLANTEFATYFRCYFKIPFLNTFYFLGSVLDNVLAVDRLVELTTLKARFRQLNPKRVSVLLVLACVVINAPYVLVFEPKKKQIFTAASNHTEYFYFYGESEFALSHVGYIFKNIQSFIRDILTLIVLVVINLITLCLFR